MVEESVHKSHSDRGVLVALPGDVLSARSTLAPVTSPFAEVKGSGPEPAFSQFFHSSDSTSAQPLSKTDAYHINVKRAHQTKFISAKVATPRQQRLGMWYKALKKKKELVLQLLELQKLIEDVEQEASNYLARDTITLYRRRYYDIEIKDDDEGIFLSSISDVRLDGQKV